MKKFNDKNPYISELECLKKGVKTAICAKGNVVSLVDSETGEIKGSGYNAVIREKQYDSERFVKLYAKGREVLPKLSISASRVLWHIISHMGYNDVITLNMTKLKKETGYKSDAVIYRAISELKRYEVLANGYQNGIYFINPTMFYRGNRLRLIDDTKAY